MSPKLRVLLAVLLGLLGGLLLGYFGRQWISIDFKRELGLGDVLNFAITLVFAFVLQNYLQKRFGNERAEKEHLIDLIKDSITFLRDTRTAFMATYDSKKILPEDAKAIKALLRNLINSIELLKGLLNTCGYNSEGSECSNIETLYLEYKRILTGGSFPTKPYDGGQFSDAEKAYGQLNSKLNHLRITLNRK
ncbi:MAG: hypothetical protein ABI539_08425 [Acidobacteriota bacterium]